MSTLRRHLQVRRWPALWLVAFSVAVRLLVPAGYMPMSGKLGLEICPNQLTGASGAAAAGAVHHAMPMHQPAHHPHAGHGNSIPGDHDHDCGFAAAVGGVADLPVVAAAPVLQPVALPIAFMAAMFARPGLGLAAPPPPKTGPPILPR